MKLVQVNVAFDPRLPTPDALLDAYHTLTGWSDALVSAGVSTSVVQAFTSDGCLHRRGVDYVFCRQGRAEAEALLAAVSSCEPDIVHLNGFDAGGVARGLRRVLSPSVPLVMQHHGGLPPRRLSSLARSMRWTMAEADAFLFTSLEQSRTWAERGYVPNGAAVFDVLEASTVMRPVAPEEARAKTGVRGTPAVLWVGRLDANKDPLAVLAGFERALESFPNATLTMVFGADALIDEVRRRVGSERLGGRVRLVGAVPYRDMADWYSSADLFVLGSHHEGSGYAVIEACACGATPVVTDIAPFRVITGGGTIGHHWPVGDAEAFGSALTRAAVQLGDESRRVVLEHFKGALSWEAVGRRARAVYEAVIARRASREKTPAC